MERIRRWLWEYDDEGMRGMDVVFGVAVGAGIGLLIAWGMRW